MADRPPPPAPQPPSTQRPPAPDAAPGPAARAAPRGTPLRWLFKPLRFILGLLLALVILFEEWGWGPLQRAMAWIGRLPVLRQIEAWIARLPPYGALAVFVLPSLALLPVKLLALWFIGQGHAGLGLSVIVAAKLAGTAVLARLFSLTRPALMQLAWFARLHARWVTYKDALLARVRASAPWRAARGAVTAVRAAARQVVLRLRRLFSAVD